MRHAVIHIQYDSTQGTFTSTANDHRSPVVAFSANLIGKPSVDVGLTFTMFSSSEKPISFDYTLRINRNDWPGFYPKAAYKRTDLTFNLQDYADTVGGFSSIQVSGKEASSVKITDSIQERPSPQFTPQFTLVEMRGNYLKGCGLSDYSSSQNFFIFNKNKVYTVPGQTDGTVFSAIECVFTETYVYISCQSLVSYLLLILIC